MDALPEITQTFEVRMLSSPMRQCFVSKHHLPSGMRRPVLERMHQLTRHLIHTDFLIRLVTLKDSEKHLKKATSVLVPDGLLHPRFSNRKFGNGHYVACWKDAVYEMMKQRMSLWSVSF